MNANTDIQLASHSISISKCRVMMRREFFRAEKITNARERERERVREKEREEVTDEKRVG
jgi:hypothetical protein